MGLTVQVEGGGAGWRAEAGVSDGDVGPLFTAERRLFHHDEAVVEIGVFVGLGIGGVPRFQRAEDAQAKMPGLVVFGEVNPDGGVVVGFVGDLDGVAEAGGEVDFGVELKPEADGSFFGIEVIKRLEIDGFGVLCREFQVLQEANGRGRCDLVLPCSKVPVVS